jgi:hypothetical protein
MTDATSPGADTLPHDHHEREMRKEAYTMALYVAICLLTALVVISEPTAQDDAIEIIWGTTLGLAVAHWFAFQVSARLVASGAIRRHDTAAAVAQLFGALGVAVLATIPVLVLDESVELDVVELVLAGFIALVGYAVARSGGARVGRSVLYAVSVLAAGLIVVVVKIALIDH